MLVRSISTSLFLLAVLARPIAAAQSTERLYQEACDGGDMIACNVFGLMLERGERVPQDLARAALLYQRACEGGELVGCTNVGLLYGAGAGLPADRARAAGFLQVACEGGEQLGCDLLRRLEDVSTALPLERYEKAGRVGDAQSGRPLAEAVVELPEVGVRVISGPDGRFLLGSVPAGRHPIRAERLGYEPLVGTLDVPGNPDFLMLMTPAETVDPDASGHIVGRVVEGTGSGLSDVEVAVVDQARARTLSNQQGRFTIREVEPGLITVRFARLGYAPRTAMLVVQPGRTAEIAATMVIEPIELEPIEVTIRPRDLERDGFYERAARGWGHHFAPGDVERISPIDISDLFRGRVPGVSVVRLYDQQWGYVTRLLSRRGASLTRGPCFLDVYVDGMLMLDQNVDLFTAEALAAAEVYYGPGTPMQYSRNACGAVLLWTRRSN